LTHKTCDRTALDEIKTRKGGLHVLDAVAARVKLFEKGRLKFQEYLTPQELGYCETSRFWKLACAFLAGPHL